MRLKFLLPFVALIVSLNCYSQVKFVVPLTSQGDSWNGTGWDNVSQTTYTFDGDCRPTSILTQFDLLGVLTNQGYSTLTYGGPPLTITHISQVWNPATMGWDNIGQTEHFYDANDDIIETRNYNWTGSWQLSNRYLYTYITPTLIDTYTVQNWDSINMVWVNVSQEKYTYTATNKPATAVTSLWNSVSSMFDINQTRTISTYNASDLLATEENDDWDGAQWVHDFLSTYSYDGDNFVDEVEESQWDVGAYVLDSRQLFTNDTNGYPTTIISQDYIAMSWVNTSRTVQTYPPCLSLGLEKNSFETVQIYPNPTENEIKVSLQKDTKYVLTNLNGQVVLKGEITATNNSIDTTNISKGLYLLQLKNENQSITKKIVKR